MGHFAFCLISIVIFCLELEQFISRQSPPPPPPPGTLTDNKGVLTSQMGHLSLLLKEQISLQIPPDTSPPSLCELTITRVPERTNIILSLNREGRKTFRTFYTLSIIHSVTHRHQICLQIIPSCDAGEFKFIFGVFFNINPFLFFNLYF
jgi:hypothetical protein